MCHKSCHPLGHFSQYRSHYRQSFSKQSQSIHQGMQQQAQPVHQLLQQETQQLQQSMQQQVQPEQQLMQWQTHQMQQPEHCRVSRHNSLKMPSNKVSSIHTKMLQLWLQLWHQKRFPKHSQDSHRSKSSRVHLVLHITHCSRQRGVGWA